MSETAITTTPARKASRRSVLQGPAIVAPAVATASLPVLAAPAGDAEIIRLSREIVALQKRLDATDATASEAEDEFQRIKPKRPDALRWQMADPVGYWSEPSSRNKGRWILWCNERDIKKLGSRKEPFYQYCFSGTQEEYDAICHAHGVEYLQEPTTGTIHLFDR